MMKRVCLVGGGHTHALALKGIAASLPHQAEITLISPFRFTPYSGMIPGTIETIYRKDEFLIDLERLARNLKVSWLEDEVVALDAKRNMLTLRSGKLLPFDTVSLNLGGEMSVVIPQGKDLMKVKPVNAFLEWLKWIDDYDGGSLDLCIVGGGAAGIEIACALRQRICRRIGNFPVDCRITLIEAGNGLLRGHSPRFVRRIHRALAYLGISVQVDSEVREHRDGSLHTSTNEEIRADKVILATPVKPPTLLKDTQLDIDEEGFISVNRFLQSISHPHVFACGDACNILGMSCPKAGVFAVRQAATLKRNIVAHVLQQPLREFPFQPRHLSIINLGNRRAAAAYGAWCFTGRWVWFWKNHLDRSFMNRLARA